MSARGADTPAAGALAAWLSVVAVLVGAMIVIGGITRLTGSGLSMVEWRPVFGVLPPLSPGEWERVFALYRETPEFLKVNSWMGLGEFRRIFWWEYVHRMWGRLIGLAYVVPFLWFIVRGRLTRRLAMRLWLLLALGGAQGLIGWWMVRSGLVDDPHVSQYRLAVHLSLAFVILGVAVWTILDLRVRSGARPAIAGTGPVPARHVTACLALVSITVVAGALVAGLDAGRIYNTFPLMAGSILPPDYGAASPAWRTLFEDPGAVQFHHRVLAAATGAAVLALALRVLRPGVPRALQGPVCLLLALVVLQTGLGIATLLTVVQTDLAILHQAVAVLLFVAAVGLTHQVRAGT